MIMKKTAPGFLMFVIAFLLVITSCKDKPVTEAGERQNGYSKNPKTKSDSLFEEVMEGHDVGMSNLGKLSGYIKTIHQAIDSTKKSKAKDPDRLPALESISADLNQADYSMNRWMEEFKIDSAETNEPVRIAYLESERDKVNKIKDRILNSIKRADSLYGRTR
jgi:hypothetical protein